MGAFMNNDDCSTNALGDKELHGPGSSRAPGLSRSLLRVPMVLTVSPGRTPPGPQIANAFTVQVDIALPRVGVLAI
jgi:hypothetical protein